MCKILFHKAEQWKAYNLWGKENEKIHFIFSKFILKGG